MPGMHMRQSIFPNPKSIKKKKKKKDKEKQFEFSFLQKVGMRREREESCCANPSHCLSLLVFWLLNLR